MFGSITQDIVFQVESLYGIHYDGFVSTFTFTQMILERVIWPSNDSSDSEQECNIEQQCSALAFFRQYVENGELSNNLSRKKYRQACFHTATHEPEFPQFKM